MTLRVLHVIPSFAGGGAEGQLVKLASGLVAAGADVHLAHLHGGPNFEAAVKSGAILHRLQGAGNHDPRVMLVLRDLIRSIEPTVVQTWLLHADVFGGASAKWCGVPWLLSERSSAAMYGSGLKFKLRRRFGVGADAIVANSDGGLSYWRDAGFSGPGYVIRNIIRMPEATARSARANASKETVLLAIGRLSEEKNYPLLLDAFETVFKQLPSARAAILGEGPMRVQLETRISGSTILSGRVSLPGHVANISERLAQAAMFVSLSRFEGTPNTVVEAIVHGCPMLVSDIPAHRELLSPNEACIVPLNSVDAIAQAMLSQLTVADAAHKQIELARRRVGEWSIEKITEQYTAVYNSLGHRSDDCAYS